MNYSDNLDSYSAGAGLPSGYTDRWDAGAWSVVDDSGNKLIREASGSNNRYFASMDAINSDADRDDVEVLVRFRVSSLPSGVTICGIALRATGTNTTENGYNFSLATPGGGTVFRIGKWLSGTGSVVSSDVAVTLAANEWWWLRGRANGSTLSFRWWKDGTSEPGTWGISLTDANVTGTGWAGFYKFTGGPNLDVAELAIATNGDTATMAAAGAALAGAASATAAGSGTLTTGIPLAGAAQAQAGASGSLGGDVALAGAAAAIASASGTLTTGIPLAGAAQGQAAASAVLAMTIRADYERSSVNLSASSISGAGDAALISLRPRLQDSEVTADQTRWLEPSARIDGVNGFRPTFRFTNYMELVPGGMHGYPWATTRRPMFTYDLTYPITWTYFDTAPTIVNGSYVEFRHSTAFTQDTVYITRSRQMSAHAVGDWLEAMASAHSGAFVPSPTAAAFTPTLTTWPAQSFIADEFTTALTNELGESIPSVPLYAAMINDTSLMPLGGVAKREAVVYSGVHAGEDLGNYMLMAFVDAVFAASAWGENLRRNYIIRIEPMITATGRAAGGWRGPYQNGTGGADDPNRHYHDATPGLDAVTKTRTVILADLDAALPDWMIDFHGHFGLKFSIFADAAEPLQGVFQSRLATYSGQTVNDAGDLIVGSTAYYFRWTLGCPFSVTHEIGDPSQLSDAEITTHADAMVRTLDSMFVQLVGAATAAASASATLAGGAAVLAGSAQDTAYAVANLTTAIQLAGASLSVASASGTLIAGVPLDGAAIAVSSAAGALTAQIRLAGAALAQAAASAGLFDAAALAGTATAVAAASAVLTTEIRLVGAATGSAGGDAYLTTAIPLSGAAIAQAIAQGWLVQDVPLQGVALAVSLASGALAASTGAAHGAMTAARRNAAQQNANTVRPRQLH